MPGEMTPGGCFEYGAYLHRISAQLIRERAGTASKEEHPLRIARIDGAAVCAHRHLGPECLPRIERQPAYVLIAGCIFECR